MLPLCYDTNLHLSVYKCWQQWLDVDGRVRPQQIMKSVVVRRLVQSMGRIMAAYFTDGTVNVYSPHQPQRMPPLHCHHQPSAGKLHPRMLVKPEYGENENRGQ